METAIKTGSLVTLKKKHPCGSFEFEVIRVGGDCRARCLGCGGVIEMPRKRFEGTIKSIKSE